MSVFFGRWNFGGQSPSQKYCDEVAGMISGYGLGNLSRHSTEDAAIFYSALHTTPESRGEVQPHILASGAILVWDGRLDNRAELLHSLGPAADAGSADVELVAQAYQSRGSRCFANLLGDWALAIWNPIDRSLLLARDFAGVRSLYYEANHRHIVWSTQLDPVVLLAGHSFHLDEEYLAGWLSSFPGVHLTPYAGIHSVPPSCYIRFRENGTAKVTRYWRLDPKSIRYRSDDEYEEHFRFVFGESVRRRLRSAGPVLAELSGGMDSSSIVCMADHLLEARPAGAPRLDTVSYYDDSEPNWDERPYFTKVESQRGRSGCHIETGSSRSFPTEYSGASFAATPAFAVQFAAASHQHVAATGYRVVLSGLGGDELLGAVASPIPALADLLVGLRLLPFARQLVSWAIATRKPIHLLLGETLKPFLPLPLRGPERDRSPLSWLEPAFVKRHERILRDYDRRLHFFPRPSVQAYTSALEGLRRQFSCNGLTYPSYEKRLPYLDRDLWEFIAAIPRDQVLRPRERRSLMRRSLVGIVPDAVLNRKRKAYVARGPLAGVAANWSSLQELAGNMISSSLGVVDGRRFLEALEGTRHGKEISVVPVLRTLVLEYWLRYLRDRAAFPGSIVVAANRSAGRQMTVGTTGEVRT